MNRSTFLKRIAGAVMAVPFLGAMTWDSAPVLVGDGVTDDTAALQRMLDDAAARGYRAVIPPGHYRISSTLVPRGPFLIDNSVIRFSCQSALDFSEAYDGTVSNCTFRYVGPEITVQEFDWSSFVDGLRAEYAA